MTRIDSRIPLACYILASSHHLLSPVMNPGKGSIIQGARAATDTYFETWGATLRLKSAAYIGGDECPAAQEEETNMRLKIHKGQMDGICKNLDLTLEYDDGSSMICVPFADVVVEHRPAMRDCADSSGRRLYIGIPASAYAVLEKLIFKTFTGSVETIVRPDLIVLELCDMHGAEYIWVATECDTPLAGSYTSEGEIKEIPDVHILFDFLKRNIVADVFVRLSLKRHSSASNGQAEDTKDDEWKLTLHLCYAYVIEATDIKRASSIEGRLCEASDDMVEAMKAMEI